ncbi:MipA/OmpV family protein [Alteromonas gilva]|uniref:MipA/OmpV family protein n=1 Tax=Alteromonas gilva TaxID=2987522 RepID=A0ABT5L3H9_9ALTE|nr:MipA/OmpV family protein [Alteromonas gilva]MDC8831588.1 MipA/OmpV family protein [Alteromonas gilva]
MLTCSFSAWACSSDNVCVEENSWQVGVALGLGARTNPLVDGDPIPLVVLPDIAWYGENSYFDNGELGYQWQLTPSLTSELFVAANTERAFFSFWHPANLMLPLTGLQDSSVPAIVDPSTGGDHTVNQPLRISINDVSKRKWSADIGTRISWYKRHGIWSFSVAGDLLGVHNGYFASLRYQHLWQWGEWLVSANASLTYKSRQLINYYYGIDADDTIDNSLWYTAGHTVQPGVGVLLSKTINKQWRWVGRVQLTALDDSMTDSPIVAKHFIASAFIGIGYQF